MTHQFALFQGRREHDEAFISSQTTELSTPTQHGSFLMRSRLETRWAKRFEDRGFVQPAYGIVNPPCYFYEPRGMKKWPTYRAGGHYRIDFVLVYDVSTRILEGEERSCATRWEWVSIKPAPDPFDLQHLKALVTFDSRHQRAFQCAGDPENAPVITLVEWTGTVAESRVAC